ncbi:putative pectinesterase/pectinesterase inhibitor 20 [Acorus calamus]|uniref:Pectinesterase/pectinesterase inhibitor 20 n=1 Tax=Acorus calamus TaxID=4465 RepID=A0AAV9CV64_ACOCL|nr:putative pectinesterase/pectinesterase inhibitor 20 [Acorus calamus]
MGPETSPTSPTLWARRLKARLSMMGTYEECVTVNKTQMFVMMIGDGINRTIITGDHSNSTGWSTFGSATVGGGYDFGYSMLILMKVDLDFISQVPSIREVQIHIFKVLMDFSILRRADVRKTIYQITYIYNKSYKGDVDGSKHLAILQ